MKRAIMTLYNKEIREKIYINNKDIIAGTILSIRKNKIIAYIKELS